MKLPITRTSNASSSVSSSTKVYCRVIGSVKSDQVQVDFENETTWESVILTISILSIYKTCFGAFSLISYRITLHCVQNSLCNILGTVDDVNIELNFWKDVPSFFGI